MPERLVAELPPAENDRAVAGSVARARHRLLARGREHDEASAAAPWPRRGGNTRRASRRAAFPAPHLARSRSSCRRWSSSSSSRTICSSWLLEPLPDDTTVITLGVTEPFVTSLKVCFFAGLAIALPIVLYQLWSFLAPAITEATQRPSRSPSVVATFLFAAGVAFGYFIVLPKALGFLTNFDEEFSTTRSGRATTSRSPRHAARHRARVRDADLHPRARPPGRLGRPAAAKPAHRLSCSSSSSRSCCRRSTLSRSRSRSFRCSLSTSSRSCSRRAWRSGGRSHGVRGGRRRRSSRPTGCSRSRASRSEDGAVAIRDGRIEAVGTAPSSGAASTIRVRRSFRASSTRTRTSSTPSTAPSATASRSRRGSRPTSNARRGSTARTWRRSRAWAPPSASPPA